VDTFTLVIDILKLGQTVKCVACSVWSKYWSKRIIYCREVI